MGYLGLLIFSALTLILESFSGKYDIVSSQLPFNMNQLFALILAAVSLYQLYKIYVSDNSSSEIV